MLVVTEQEVRGRGVIKEEVKGTIEKKRRKERVERKGDRTRKAREWKREAFLLLII